MTRLKVSAAGCLGWVAAAVAGPINMNWVAPDAAWIVHIDVDAVRGSTIGKFIIANWDKEDEAELAAVKAKIGIDPVHDLKGVTVFGKSRNPEEFVAVVTTTAAVDAAVEKLVEKEHQLTKLTEGTLTLYSWSEHGVERYGYIKPGAKADERIVLAAPDKGRLLAAIRRVDGDVPPVPAAAVLPKPPRAGSMLFVVGTVGENLKPPGDSMILKKVESVRIDAGEANGEIYGEASVTAPTSEDATNMLQMAQGAIAVAKMCAQNDEDLKALVKAGDWLTLSAEDRTVTARVKCSSKQFQEMLESAEPKVKAPESKPQTKEPAKTGEEKKK